MASEGRLETALAELPAFKVLLRGRRFGLPGSVVGVNAFVVLVAVGALVAAAVADRTLTLPGPAVGLLEHPAIYVFLFSHLLVPALLIRSVRALERLPMHSTVLARDFLEAPFLGPTSNGSPVSTTTMIKGIRSLPAHATQGGRWDPLIEPAKLIEGALPEKGRDDLPRSARSRSPLLCPRPDRRVPRGRRPYRRLHGWLKRTSGRRLPPAHSARPCAYWLNHWEALTRFLDDGRLPLDNTEVERQIRALALGRKNYLFAGPTKELAAPPSSTR